MEIERYPDRPPYGVSAKAMIARADGAVLLVRRAGHSIVDPSLWDLPGGKMDVGEALADTAVREAREETGLEVRATIPFRVEHFTAGPLWITCVTFLCSLAEGQVTLSDEHGEFAWIAPGELEGRDFAHGIRAQLEAYFGLDATTRDAWERQVSMGREAS